MTTKNPLSLKPTELTERVAKLSSARLATAILSKSKLILSHLASITLRYLERTHISSSLLVAA